MSSDPLGRQLLLQFALILLNAFFAATEIAVLSLNENRIRMKADAGDKKAARMLKIVQTPTSFLSTIQIGITLAGFLGSAFAADNFAGRITEWAVRGNVFSGLSENTIHTLSVIVITLILSYFTLVLGELVPKRIAMQKPEAVARMSCGVIRVIAILVKPIIWLLSVSTNGVLRLFRIDPRRKEEAVSEEEIRYMVDMGEERGAIESSEKEMIENIFEFNNMCAEDVMVHRTDIQFIWEDDTKEDILDVIRQSGFSRFPVCGEDADDILGVLITREYLLNLQSTEPKPMRDILRAPYLVPESVRTDVLFRNMQSAKNHMAIVVDEYGGTSGLVTLEDLLEEIVGNIYDESDPQDEHEIKKLGDNLWRIAGFAELEQISEELGVPLPESEEFDTLGGLIINHLSAIPEDGSSPEICAHGLLIQVQEVKDHRIEWALVSIEEKCAGNPSEAEADTVKDVHAQD